MPLPGWMHDEQDFDPRIRDDERMVALLWRQHQEHTALCARQSQEFVTLALTIRREVGP